MPGIFCWDKYTINVSDIVPIEDENIVWHCGKTSMQ